MKKISINMKFIVLPLAILFLIGCKKETSTPQTTNPDPALHNLYDFRITGEPDTNLVMINGHTATISNIGNRKNITINPGDNINFYYSFAANKKRLGPYWHPGLNLDSLINYYILNADKESSSNFAIWNSSYVPSETIRYSYPKQRMIINGQDTNYKIYIKGSFTY